MSADDMQAEMKKVVDKFIITKYEVRNRLVSKAIQQVDEAVEQAFNEALATGTIFTEGISLDVSAAVSASGQPIGFSAAVRDFADRIEATLKKYDPAAGIPLNDLIKGTEKNAQGAASDFSFTVGQRNAPELMLEQAAKIAALALIIARLREKAKAADSLEAIMP